MTCTIFVFDSVCLLMIGINTTSVETELKLSSRGLLQQLVFLHLFVTKTFITIKAENDFLNSEKPDY